MAKNLTKDEEYVVSESKELYLGEERHWATRIMRAFPAFRYRNYKLYFTGQVISLVGFWLQIVAEGWLVFQLTHSALWVGIIGAVGTVPSLLFSLIGGVIVDRISKKKILITTQSVALVLATILGILVEFHWMTVPILVVLAFFLGLVDAIDTPARQAFVVDLVDREDLSSAIALNSGMFNFARVLGPSIAGILIGLTGLASSFYINAVSFIPAIIVINMMIVKEIPSRDHPHPIEAIKEGLRFSFGHTTIRILMIFAAVVTIFGWSYSTLLPVMVENVFKKGATELGYMYAASGVGALLATMLISAYAKKVKDTTFIFAGSLVFCLGLFLFTLTSSFVFALLFLFLIGFGLTSQFSVINASIQHLVSDEIRGRVMSIYTVMFLGMSPVGSFLIGVGADKLTSDHAIQIGVTIVFLFLVYVFLNRVKLFVPVID